MLQKITENLIRGKKEKKKKNNQEEMTRIKIKRAEGRKSVMDST